MLDRKIAPTSSKEFIFHLPPAEVISLENGLNIIWVKEVPQEVLKIEIVFNAGRWHEPKAGLAYFTSHMLEKGTRKNSAEKIAALLDQQGSQLEISTGADFTSVALYTLSKNVEKVMPVLFEMIQESTFPESELALMKNIFLETLKVNNEKTSFIASKALQGNIFGKRHPYGRSIAELDVEKISILDLQSFFKESFSPHEIYITGNLNPQQFSLLTQTLSDILPKKSIVQHAEQIEMVSLREHIQKEKSVQSAIRFGKKTIKRKHPQYAGVLLLNHLLGGYFGSRLMKNIREEKGLTYGIHSSVNSYYHDGTITIATDTNKEKLEITIEEILKEIQSLSDKLIPKEELEVAKNHFLGNLQLEVSNSFSVMDKIKTMRLFDLGPNFYSALFEGLKKTNQDELQAIANQQFSPNEFTIVSVG